MKYLPPYWWLTPWEHAKNLAETLEEKNRLLSMARIHIGVRERELEACKKELKAAQDKLKKKKK